MQCESLSSCHVRKLGSYHTHIFKQNLFYVAIMSISTNQWLNSPKPWCQLNINKCGKWRKMVATSNPSLPSVIFAGLCNTSMSCSVCDQTAREGSQYPEKRLSFKLCSNMDLNFKKRVTNVHNKTSSIRNNV